MKLYSLFTFLFTVFVIIWGALVRATRSGAGCGAHWPLCNGEVLPLSAELETLIEFTHRTSSGLSALLVFFLYLFTVREFGKGTLQRSAAFHASFFMFVEVAIGAVIVLFGWVKDDTSGVRAVMIAFHLVNSFLLIASLAVHVQSVFRERVIYLKKPLFMSGPLVGRILLLGFLLVGSAGAITALGDTLFPPETVRADFYNYMSSANHFLVQLRIIHPVAAVLFSFLLLLFIFHAIETGRKRKPILYFSYASLFFLIVQLFVGPLTIFLLAPLYLQLLHLAVSIFLWTSFVMLVYEIELEFR